MSATLPVRDRLLTAATEVFASKGYSATRVSDSVQQAGVAQETFYLYFKSEQAIFEHLIDTFCSRLLADTLGTFRPSRGSRPDEFIAQARLLWRTVLQRCRQERALVSLVLREAGAAGPELMARIQANYQRVIDSFATSIEAAITHGLCRSVDPQLAGWAIFGMLERAVHYAVLVDQQADLDQVADDLIRLELGAARRWVRRDLCQGRRTALTMPTGRSGIDARGKEDVDPPAGHLLLQPSGSQTGLAGLL